MAFDTTAYSTIYNAIESEALDTTNQFFDSYEITGEEKAQIIANVINNIVTSSLKAMTDDKQMELMDAQKLDIEASIALKEAQTAETLAGTTRQNNLATAEASLKSAQEAEIQSDTIRKNNLANIDIAIKAQQEFAEKIKNGETGATYNYSYMSGDSELSDSTTDFSSIPNGAWITSVVVSDGTSTSMYHAETAKILTEAEMIEKQMLEVDKNIDLKDAQIDEAEADTIRKNNIANADTAIKSQQEFAEKIKNGHTGAIYYYSYMSGETVQNGSTTTFSNIPDGAWVTSITVTTGTSTSLYQAETVKTLTEAEILEKQMLEIEKNLALKDTQIEDMIKEIAIKSAQVSLTNSEISLKAQQEFAEKIKNGNVSVSYKYKENAYDVDGNINGETPEQTSTTLSGVPDGAWVTDVVVSGDGTSSSLYGVQIANEYLKGRNLGKDSTIKEKQSELIVRQKGAYNDSVKIEKAKALKDAVGLEFLGTGSATGTITNFNTAITALTTTA
jgi:hypothetical protein